MRRRRLRPYLRDRLARDLRRYLIEGEIPVASVRQHWMSQIKPMAACAGTLALAIWMDLKAPPTAAGNSASQAFWLLWLVTLVWLGWRAVNWRRDWFVATDKRFLLFYGFLHRRVAMMPLAKVTDLTFHRSILGRIIGYGDFRLESAGQQQALSQIDFIPHADTHYREICAVLFGSTEDERDDGFDDGDERNDGWDDGGDWPAAPTGWDPVDDRVVSSSRDDFPHSGPIRYAAGSPERRARGIRRDRPNPRDDRQRGQSVYQSDDLLKAARLADTGEIPVVPAKRIRPPRR
jgi:hypothetical protein